MKILRSSKCSFKEVKAIKNGCDILVVDELETLLR